MTSQITDAQVMHIQRAIELVDGQNNLRIGLGLKSQGTVSQWVTRRRPLPAKHCINIEELTKGEVKRYDLRPDVFGSEPLLQQAA